MDEQSCNYIDSEVSSEKAHEETCNSIDSAASKNSDEEPCNSIDSVESDNTDCINFSDKKQYDEPNLKRKLSDVSHMNMFLSVSL